LVNLKVGLIEKSVQEIMTELEEKVKDIPGANGEFQPPAVDMELQGGFELRLLDKTSSSVKKMEKN
jgi:HAE1 family hydrophobic/amphiphilic exporter-1